MFSTFMNFRSKKPGGEKAKPDLGGVGHGAVHHGLLERLRDQRLVVLEAQQRRCRGVRAHVAVPGVFRRFLLLFLLRFPVRVVLFWAATVPFTSVHDGLLESSAAPGKVTRSPGSPGALSWRCLNAPCRSVLFFAIRFTNRVYLGRPQGAVA